MLPRPATAGRRLGGLRGWSTDRNSNGIAGAKDLLRVQFLLARTRVTNLAVLLLFCGLLFSLGANLRYYQSTHRHSLDREREVDRAEQTKWNISTPGSLSAVVDNSLRARATHLVIVAGHAIWSGCDAKAWQDENNWALHEYQKGGGSVDAFYHHISKGVEIAKSDPAAILMFSGGTTRFTRAADSEAESYLRLALDSGLLSSAAPNAFTEEFALDSFQNLLFAIARFHEVVALNGEGGWPIKITVVGFEMKRRRFEELHRKALRFPKDRFAYVGVDATEQDARTSGWAGEEKNGYLPYTQDLYGCHGDLLAKRRSRNPFAKTHPYHSSAPQLHDLLEWCPDSPATVYPGKLPWDPS